MIEAQHKKNTAPNNTKRCHLEQGMLDMAAEQGIRYIRVIQTAEQAWIIEATFQKKGAPYYLATARAPYEPREFLQVQTAVQKVRDLFAVREVAIVFQ